VSELGDEIEAVRFTPVRLRDGYDMVAVDGLLDRLAAAARAGSPLAPLVAATHVDVTRLREGYDIDEVDAFLVRVAGRTVDRPDTSSDRPTPVISEERGLLPRVLAWLGRRGRDR